MSQLLGMLGSWHFDSHVHFVSSNQPFFLGRAGGTNHDEKAVSMITGLKDDDSLLEPDCVFSVLKNERRYTPKAIDARIQQYMPRDTVSHESNKIGSALPRDNNKLNPSSP